MIKEIFPAFTYIKRVSLLLTKLNHLDLAYLNQRFLLDDISYLVEKVMREC